MELVSLGIITGEKGVEYFACPKDIKELKEALSHNLCIYIGQDQ